MARSTYPSLFSGTRYLALLQAFCDESHVYGERIYTVAGWVAEENEWAVLAGEWKNRLNRDGLDCFHATDCAGSNNDFKHLSKDACINLDTDLVTILTQHRLTGFAISVSYKDFKEIVDSDADAEAILTKQPYFIAAQLIVRSICDATKEIYPEGHKIAFFFEQNEEVSGQAKQMMDEMLRRDSDMSRFVASITYVGKDDMVPLQCADELAFEAAKDVQNFLDKRNTRAPIKRMMDAKILHRSDLLNKQNMIDYIQRQKVQKMDRVK